MSQLEKIKSAFSRRGFREKSRITENQFINLLNELRGRTFDEEVALEIWDQAESKSNQRVEVDELCQIIFDAQNILYEKLEETQQNIENLIEKRRQIQTANISQQERINQLQNINYNIQELQKDKLQYEQDLQLVTDPFDIDYKSLKESYRPTGIGKPSQSRKSRGQTQENTILQHLFYVVLVMALIQVIVIYKKYDFLNLLVLVTAMSIFMLNYFDNTYNKLCAGLAGISVAADFTWLIMYGGSFWSPSLLSEHSSAQSGYLKLIVLLTLINIVAKVYLVYLILKQGSIQAANDFTINPFEGVSLNVAANTGNIITRSCKGGAGGYL